MIFSILVSVLSDLCLKASLAKTEPCVPAAALGMPFPRPRQSQGSAKLSLQKISFLIDDILQLGGGEGGGEGKEKKTLVSNLATSITEARPGGGLYPQEAVSLYKP